MKPQPPFDPGELRPIRDWIKEGKIPMTLNQTRREAARGKFPAVKNGRDWCTTEAQIRGYFWRKANKAFKATTV
jgi:hypothetical protein